MEQFTATLLVFLVGLLVGAASAWLLLPARRQQRHLKRERDDALEALKRYRDDVDHHFLRTAELVNQLNEAYRDVHQQLSEGARTLCSEQGRRLAAAQNRDMLADDNDTGPAVHAPLDYAPSQKGTLAEDFGLKEKEAAFDAATPDGSGADPEVAPPRDYAEGCDAQGCPPDTPTANKA
jgi:hypothetical protein